MLVHYYIGSSSCTICSEFKNMSNTSCSTTWWFPFFKVSWVAFASIDLVLIFVGFFSMTGFGDFSISMPGPEMRKVKMSPGNRLLPIVCRNTSEPNSTQVSYRRLIHPTHDHDHDSEFVRESWQLHVFGANFVCLNCLNFVPLGLPKESKPFGNENHWRCCAWLYLHFTTHIEGYLDIIKLSSNLYA